MILFWPAYQMKNPLQMLQYHFCQYGPEFAMGRAMGQPVPESSRINTMYSCLFSKIKQSKNSSLCLGDNVNCL